jgi:hypothetical protein
MKTFIPKSCFLAVLLSATLWRTALFGGEKAAPLSTFARLPIRELTVFKDGHALVAHEGRMPTDQKGEVVMDYLPAPVIGTFWPYSAEPGARLSAVVASQKRVLVEHTALTLRELLEANIGAQAIITESGKNSYEAQILELPSRSSEELAATSPPNAGEKLPEKGNLILLKTWEGTKAIPIDRIQDITIKGPHHSTLATEEFRNLLTLKLDWGKKAPEREAKVGLFYLQKGVRWIPSYKVDLDGDGNAVVRMQAEILNELADLEDVSVNLVVGVPTFAFKETLDPIALQQSLAALSPYFQTDAGRNSLLAANFSNAIMSQQLARAGDFRAPGNSGDAGALSQDIADTGRSEDLFIFTVPHVSLRKGERMIVPVAEFTVRYEDLFTLELPFAPPSELRPNLNTEQQRELARLFNSPKVIHKLRLHNSSSYPLTTAPALIAKQGRVLAQGLMTYTSPGSTVDLTLTTAVEFQVKKTDVETKRTPNAVQENGNSYTRIDLSGRITITSHRAKPAELEVTRYVLGAADNAGHEGKVEKLSVFENGEFLPAGDYPGWWGWYGWPSWWSYFNGVGRVTWKVKLEPGAKVELPYEWHYFWR